MAEGLTLKGWKVGRKLGAGACSDVYEAEPVAPLAGSRDCEFVIKVSPLVQLPPAKLKNKKRKKTPAERHADALYAEHLLYKNHLGDRAGIPFVPHGAYGEDKGFRFLVIERLGRTLEAVLRENGPVPPPTAARLGFNILETIKHMHVCNILYVDVKPENFMLDSKDESQVYCLDFGISDRYVTAVGKHKEYKEGPVVGTPTFLSLNCHGGATPSRRDDIESLLYVLLYLMRGDLPWGNASSDAEGAKIKKSTSIESLCSGVPSEWAAMLKNIRACAFEDKPDYDFFSSKFDKLASGKAKSAGPFEWGSGRASKAVKKIPHTATPPDAAGPEPKRAKGDGKVNGKNDEATSPEPAKEPKRKSAGKATTKKAEVAASESESSSPESKPARSSRSAGTKSKPSSGRESKPRAKKAAPDGGLEGASAPVEVDELAALSSHDRRQKAAQKALAGAVAARAAATRAANGPSRAYNLRSSSESQ